MRRLITLTVLGISVALACASAHGLEDRQYMLQRRVAEDIQHRRISPRDAARIERDLEKVARHIDGERNEHRGRLTPREWERLGRELDRVENRLREAERWAPRYERDGRYDRDRRYEREGYRFGDENRPRW